MRRRYSEEFKSAALARVEELNRAGYRPRSGRPGSVRRVARELGISPQTLQTWVTRPAGTKGWTPLEVREEALRLRAKEGLSWRQIAVRVGVPASTALGWAALAEERRGTVNWYSEPFRVLAVARMTLLEETARDAGARGWMKQAERELGVPPPTLRAWRRELAGDGVAGEIRH